MVTSPHSERVTKPTESFDGGMKKTKRQEKQALLGKITESLEGESK